MRGICVLMASGLLKVCGNMAKAGDGVGRGVAMGDGESCVPRQAIAKKGTRLYMSSVSNDF